MKQNRQLLAVLLLFITCSVSLLAQGGAFTNPNAQWKLLTPSVTGMPGEVVEVKVQVTIAAKSHLYSMSKPKAEGPQETVVTAGEKNVLALGGRVRTNKKPIRHYDENFEDTTEYWEGGVTFTVPVKLAKNLKPGKTKAWVNFYFMTCDDRACQPPNDSKLTFDVDVKPDTAALNASTLDTTQPDNSAAILLTDTTAKPKDTSDLAGGAPGKPTPPGMDAENKDTVSASSGSNTDVSRAKGKGLGAYLAVAAGAGLLALLTPCVFPMIPITVSFFTKRKQSTRKGALMDASLYSLGIILTFTLIGFLISILFGATAVGAFAANPVVNLLIAAIFIIFALNLFGMFEIQVPTSLLNRLNKSVDTQGSSVGGILMMGLIFSLTSFTCTGPFVGTVLTSAAGGDYLWPLMGMAVFAAVFAAPFFLLALFPALMKSLPKSGGWLNSVKVVMGFLETAAAIKFLSNADLVWQWGIFTRELFLSIWIAIAAVMTFYLLGRFQLPHDSPVERVGPVRVLFAVGSLSFGFWLLTGLFGGRLGEIDAFIAPQEYPGMGSTAVFASFANGGGGSGGSHASKPNGPNEVTVSGLTWLQDDYKTAVKLSRESGKPVFIDFTGYTCTNCRWMELNMFTRNEVASKMKEYVLLRLYTDNGDSINNWNRELQFNRFKTVSLPYYAVVSAQDSIVGDTGYTRDTKEFLEFLEKGLGAGSMAVR